MPEGVDRGEAYAARRLVLEISLMRSREARAVEELALVSVPNFERMPRAIHLNPKRSALVWL